MSDATLTSNERLLRAAKALADRMPTGHLKDFHARQQVIDLREAIAAHGNETNPPLPTDEEAGERLASFVQAYQTLSDMPAQQLVNIALEHCMGRSQMQELVIEELCSRAYPNWPNEDPAHTPALKAGDGA